MENEQKNQPELRPWERFKNSLNPRRFYSVLATAGATILLYVGFSTPEAKQDLTNPKLETNDDVAGPEQAILENEPAQNITRETVEKEQGQTTSTEEEIEENEPEYKSFLPPGSLTIYLPHSSKKILQYDAAETLFKAIDDFENAPIRDMLKEAQKSLMALLPEIDDELSLDIRQKLEAWDDHLVTLEADIEFIRKYVSPGVELTQEIADRLEDIEEQTAYFSGQVRHFNPQTVIKLYGMPDVKDRIDDLSKFMSDNGNNIPDEVTLFEWKEKMMSAIDAIEADYDYEAPGILRPRAEISGYPRELTKKIYDDLTKLRSMKGEAGSNKHDLLMSKARFAAERIFNHFADSITIQPKYMGNLLGSPFHSVVNSSWSHLSPIKIEMLVVDYDPLAHLATTVESLGDDVNLENVIIASDMLPHQAQGAITQYQEAVRSSDSQRISETEEIVFGLIIGTHIFNYDDEIILNPDYSPSTPPSFEYRGRSDTKHYTDIHESRNVYIDIEKAKLYIKILKGLTEHGAEIRTTYEPEKSIRNLDYYVNKENAGGKTVVVITTNLDPHKLGVTTKNAADVTTKTFEELHKKWQNKVNSGTIDPPGRQK